MPNGPIQTMRFRGYPALDDVTFSLEDAGGNVLIAPTNAGVISRGDETYTYLPAYPAGFQYGLAIWHSASLGDGDTQPVSLDAPVPPGPLTPAAPAPTAEAVSTDANGYLTLYVSVAGAGDGLTITDGGGQVVYQGAGLGTPTTLYGPVDPIAPAGDFGNPGEVVAWTWDLSGLPAMVLAGTSEATGSRALAVRVAPASLPPFPDHLLSVAQWRTRLRRAVFDAPLDPDDPASVVIAAAALDDGLREALSALTLWSPEEQILPPLTLTAGRSVYPLPADFADPVESTWGGLLGPDPFASGRLPGARYALLRRQSALDAAPTGSVRGGGLYGYGYGTSWAGGYGAGRAILPEDAQGNATSGPHTRSCAELFPADFDHDTPFLLLTPAPPATGRPMTTLRYRAAWLPRRLTLGTDGQWVTDESGALVYSLAPLGADFNDETDVLPFANTSDLVRQSLRYATYWVLSQKVLSLSDTDGESFAFYQSKTGMGRGDIQKVADRAKAEFDERNKHRPRGTRG